MGLHGSHNRSQPYGVSMGCGARPKTMIEPMPMHKRTHWMRYRHYSRQRLPIGSGITEAACKIVCTQRLKRSGMSWTIEGGQVILDLRVIWLSGIWMDALQRYLASNLMTVCHSDM